MTFQPHISISSFLARECVWNVRTLSPKHREMTLLISCEVSICIQTTVLLCILCVSKPPNLKLVHMCVQGVIFLSKLNCRASGIGLVKTVRKKCRVWVWVMIEKCSWERHGLQGQGKILFLKVAYRPQSFCHCQTVSRIGWAQGMKLGKIGENRWESSCGKENRADYISDAWKVGGREWLALMYVSSVLKSSLPKAFSPKRGPSYWFNY